MTNPFWREEEAEALYLAEHGGVSSFSPSTGEHVAEFGNEALLPPWPPEVTPTGTGRYITPSEPTPAVLCAVCGTPVKLHGDAGWRHELGYRATGGCSTPWPEG